MLIKLLGSTIIILLFIIVVNAQSQRPFPSPGIKSNPPQAQTPSKQQPTEADKRGTEQSPLIIKTINPPKTQAEADQERKEHEDKSSQDWWLVRFTGFLACVAFLQLVTFVFQAIYLYKGFEATAKAANAADASAKALTASERAYLFVTIIMKTPDAENIAGIADKEPQYNEGIVKLIVTNHGKTPAILTAYPYTTEVLTSNEIDKKIDKLTSDDIETWVPFGPVVIDSNTALKEWSTGFFINDKKWRQISMEEAFLACIGCLHYQDIFGKTHKTVFCWKYEQFSGFHYDKDPKRNYRT